MAVAMKRVCRVFAKSTIAVYEAQFRFGLELRRKFTFEAALGGGLSNCPEE